MEILSSFIQPPQQLMSTTSIVMFSPTMEVNGAHKLFGHHLYIYIFIFVQQKKETWFGTIVESE